jgi:hypothetical protein
MNGERGQALPVAMLALAVGSLVVVPFLSHAGSSLISSRVHGEVIAEQSASDAGIEHAIWSLTYGVLAEQFTQSGDEVTYQLDETLNGCNTTVTVTANATSQGGSGGIGDIADTAIDAMIFDNTRGYYPDIIHISGNIYAAAYQGTSADGFIKTVEIAPDGSITNSVIDTLEFDTSDCIYPDIIYISGNTFAIAYQGPGSDGFIKTVSIAVNGQIGNSVIDTLEFDTSDGWEPVITPVSGDIYAVAYRGSSNDGFIKTVSIAADGQIGNSIIDTLEYDTSNGYYPNIVYITGNIYAIAYMGVSNDGFIKTVSITTAGAIGDFVIDTLEFDTADCSYPDILFVSGNTYAIAYQGPGSDGFIKTASIATNGQIGNSVIDTLEFDTGDGREPKMINVTGDVFGVVYCGADNSGFLKTLSISPGGDIGGGAIDTMEYETGEGYYPKIIRIAEGVYAIAYSGPSMMGDIKTVKINTEATVSALWEIVSTAGNTTIRDLVNTVNTTSTIISWQIE